MGITASVTVIPTGCCASAATGIRADVWCCIGFDLSRTQLSCHVGQLTDNGRDALRGTSGDASEQSGKSLQGTRTQLS